MGALAPPPPPPSHWLPQDDFELRKAVERGASLESLAKGAVQFSRRFTVQELQDRWYSLLYDPDISAEASFHMSELEHSTSIVQSKSDKEANFISGKRKAESVRRCYYAMRKRICSDPFDLVDVNFLGGLGYSDAGNREEPVSADCLLGDQVSNLYGIQESNSGVMHRPFPELRVTGATCSGDGVSTTGFHDDNERPQNICPTFDENISVTGNDSTVEDFGQLKALQACELFESMELDVKHSPTFCQINDEVGNACSGVGSKMFNSSASVHGASSHNFGYSSPISEMPTWNADGGFPASTVADILGDREQLAENGFVVPHNVDATDRGIPGYDASQSICELKDQLPYDNMKGSALNAEAYFAELSKSLLNFTTEDELLFTDTDGKDIIDESYLENLSSLLLDFPDESGLPNVDSSEASVAPHDCTSVAPHESLPTTSSAHAGESGDKRQCHCGDRRLGWSLETQKLSSALTVNPDFPELRNGVICCTFNMEDPEIPNNDDVFLPIRLPSISFSCMPHTKFDEAYYSVTSSVKEFSNGQQVVDRVLSECEPSNFTQLHVLSQITEFTSQPETGSDCQINDHGPMLEPPNYEIQHAALSKARTGESPSIVHSGNKNIIPGSFKERFTEIEKPKSVNDPNASDSRLTFHKNAAVRRLQADGTFNIQNHEALHGELQHIGKTVPEPVTSPTVSDQEEASCNSDDDVPCFSDVEAMILDMDLKPDDQDVYYTPEVLRYQHEDAKRTIIRLEQAADAYTRRAISDQGAFAVLYGHHSKHFIRKPKVLLGRATQGVKVDIDLGMESQASRISRRQATIQMDLDGSFHLKNHGKGSVYVNGQKVVPREDVSLVSGCLIEVRGITFVFETSSVCVKQYLDNVAKGRQRWELKTLSGC